jgi:MOSC domain-containing protein YiiM
MPSGTILSVNVGRSREVLLRGKPTRTGIFKTPVEGRVALRRHSLDGDEPTPGRMPPGGKRSSRGPWGPARSART